MARRVFFDVSPELFLQMMHLPADVTILDAEVVADRGYPVLRFHVQAAAFEDIPEDAPSPEATPTIRSVNGHPEFVGWGL